MARRQRISSSRTSTSYQVHVTGRDLMEMERQRREDVAVLTQEGVERHEAAMRALSPIAVKLHTIPVAGAALGGLVVLSLVGFALSFPLWWAAGVLYALDWHNVTTLHGRINWPLFRYNKGNGLYWTSVIGLALFTFIPAGIYLVQCMQMAGEVRERERMRLREQIDAMERELLPPSDSH